MEDKIFDISFEFDNKTYKGRVNPSDNLNDYGTPVSFHAIPDDTSFGYVSYKDCKWMIDEERPKGWLSRLVRKLKGITTFKRAQLI